MASAYMPDPPAGEKSHGISTDLMVLRRGMPTSRILKKNHLFLISGIFCSFWDVAAENKPILWEGTI